MGGGVRRTENKSVLINGAAGGLGRKTALRLAEKGARLALTDFNVAGLDAGSCAPRVHPCSPWQGTCAILNSSISG